MLNITISGLGTISAKLAKLVHLKVAQSRYYKLNFE